MANRRKANVIYVDTSVTLTDVRRVRSIKFIGDLGTSADITSLKTDHTVDTGNLLWEQEGSQDIQGLPLDVMNTDLDIREMSGIRVNVSGGAVVYLYLE